jgi:hypothetical protein
MRTTLPLPVARINESRGCAINSRDVSWVGFSMHCRQCSGAPALCAASMQMRMVSATHRRAAWGGLTINGLRVFSEISALKIAVEVGFVTGTKPRMGPMGRAISMMPLRGSSYTTPTVF